MKSLLLLFLFVVAMIGSGMLVGLLLGTPQFQNPPFALGEWCKTHRVYLMVGFLVSFLVFYQSVVKLSPKVR